MNRLHLIACVAVAALVTVASAEPVAEDAEKAKLAKRMAPFIRAVAKADHPTTAMAAYSRGRAIDRDDVKLHEAYLRRMLKFGLPKIAWFAARELVVLDRTHGMAWGLIGYVEGKGGNYADALSATVRALDRLGADSSVLHNAGQLFAWYDSELDLPDLSDPVKRSMARLRTKLRANEVFQKAYKAIRDTYLERTRLGEALEKRVVSAESDARAVYTVAKGIDTELRDLNDEIDQRNRVIDDLNRELRYYSPFYYSRYGYGYAYTYGWNVYVPGGHSRAYRTEMYNRIRREEQAVDRLKQRSRRIRSDGQAVLVELNHKRSKLEELRDRIHKLGQRLQRTFRWDPPTVDGVVTPELDRFPVLRGRRQRLPRDPETEAAQRFKLAGLYLRNGLPEKAVDLLRDIVKNYPQAPAAKDARTLLSALKPLE